MRLLIQLENLIYLGFFSINDNQKLIRTHISFLHPLVLQHERVSFWDDYGIDGYEPLRLCNNYFQFDRLYIFESLKLRAL